MFDRAPHRFQLRQGGALRPQWSRLAVLALVLGTAGAGRAADGDAIFQIDDAPGEVHLSDDAPLAASLHARRLCGGTHAETATPARMPAQAPLADIVRVAAGRQRLDPDLLSAVIAVESGYRRNAVSPRGASGLMQLMPPVASAYGVTDVFDARQNIDAGARHLRFLLDRYGQDVARALGADNAGPRAIDRSSGGSGHWPNAETAAYVPRVLDRYAALRLRTASALSPTGAMPAFQP